MTKTLKRRLVSLLSASVLVVSLLIPQASAANDVIPWTATIGGSTAKLVSVKMRDGRTGEVMLANNSVVSTATAQTLIDGKNAEADTKVVAAINGGFFNAYASGTPVFPSNCTRIFNTIVTDNKLILAGGGRPTIGFTEDGRVMIDRVKFLSKVKLGNGFSCGNWGVNYYYSDPMAIMLFNDYLTLPVTIPSSSTMVFIQNGRVTQITSGGVLRVPKGADVLVYNSAIAEVERGHNRFPEVGMSAELVLTAEPSIASNASAWSQIETAVAGGPLILLNGQNVTHTNTDYTESSQQPNVVAQRSFLGVTSSGSLLLGTANASFNQIAAWLQTQGVVDAVSMDGGGSSMLYVQGSGFLTAAGRQLASAIAIVDHSSTGSSSAPVIDVPPSGDAPSAWAQASVDRAIRLGLVPDKLQCDYRSNITRQDFCKLTASLMQTQDDLEDWLSPYQYEFPDTRDADVLLCARLNLVSGDENGYFRPTRTLTRAEAARILSSAAQLLGERDTGRSAGFADSRSFAVWAAPYINFCGTHGIMNGDSQRRFNANGLYTREQAIITMLNLYENT